MEARIPATKSEIKSHASVKEAEIRKQFYKTFENCPIPSDELLPNLGLFLNRQTLSRIVYMNELYQKILDVPGIVIEFGVRWGQNLALFSSFRGMYEPFNYSRKIVGFDTFAGFPAVAPQDGSDRVATVGGYAVTQGYASYLDSVLTYHENESPLSHIRKYELVVGDATVTLENYLGEHPETIIALAYFDLDLYEPTKKCLALIRDHLTKGSVLGFDELNHSTFPGETIALKEAIGLERYRLRRLTLNPFSTYLVIE